MSSQQKPDTTEWDECAVGQLQSLSVDIRDRQRNQRNRRLFVAASFAAVAVWVGVAMWPAPTTQTTPTAKLKCTEVIAHLAAYDAGALSPELRQQVESHLEYCPHCRDQLKRIQSIRQTSVGVGSSTLTRAVHATLRAFHLT